MQKTETKGAALAVRQDGAGPPLVFLHDLGATAQHWDGVLGRMSHHHCTALDLRGHGTSDVPHGPYKMGGLIGDIETVMDSFEIRDAVVVGVGLGGMIAQGLAVKRLDLVRGLVLCATAAKFGQPDPWHTKAKIARTQGMRALAEDTFTRWGGAVPNTAKGQFLSTTPEGYAACCEAIAGTDFYTPTSGLRLPTVGLCGTADKTTPPDLARETTDLIPGSEFHLIRGAGHLTPLTHPADVALHLTQFLRNIGHI